MEGGASQQGAIVPLAVSARLAGRTLGRSVCGRAHPTDLERERRVALHVFAVRVLSPIAIAPLTSPLYCYVVFSNRHH
jgi:hypothetical protein